jgi:uncharacterized membrane protein HdeD (DUF308 family)
MIPLAVVYGVLLFKLQTFTGRVQLDGIVGIVLGLYICSHPAANLVDRILFGRFLFQPGRPRRDIAVWWGLNVLVMFLGLAVIFSGMTRFTAL